MRTHGRNRTFGQAAARNWESLRQGRLIQRPHLSMMG